MEKARRELSIYKAVGGLILKFTGNTSQLHLKMVMSVPKTGFLFVSVLSVANVLLPLICFKPLLLENSKEYDSVLWSR